MSKYNRFAKDLDAAFKTSRNVYAKTYSKYAQAERAAKDAQRRAPDDTNYSYVLRMAEAEVDRVEKKELFEEVRKNAWSVFNSKREKLRAELEKAIAADCITDPAAPDTNAVYLLDSGTRTAATMRVCRKVRRQSNYVKADCSPRTRRRRECRTERTRRAESGVLRL